MNGKKSFVMFIVSAIVTGIWGLFGLLCLFLILPATAGTYYPIHYLGGSFFLIGILIAFILATIGFFRLSKNKKAMIFFIIGVLCIVVGFASRSYVKNNSGKLTANKTAYRAMKETTYHVYGLDYKLPASWGSNPLQTTDSGEIRSHYPSSGISFEKGQYYFIGFDVTITGNDFTNDYSGFLKGFFSGTQNYRIQNTEYVRNDKFDFTALKQECTADIDGDTNYYLVYLVEDRENSKMYMVYLQKPDEFSDWNRADFDAVIDNLD